MVFKQFVTILDTFYTNHALPSKKLVKFKFQSSEPYHGHTQTPIVSLKITYFIILNPASSVYDIFEIFLAHFFDHVFSANFTGPNQAVRAPLSYADININIHVFRWGIKVYVQFWLEPSSGILHRYQLTRGFTLTSQNHNPSSVVYVPEP